MFFQHSLVIIILTITEFPQVFRTVLWKPFSQFMDTLLRFISWMWLMAVVEFRDA